MQTRETRKKRVVWTDEEIDTLAIEAVQISLLEKEFIWWFINKAQGALPENRRRAINGKNGINEKIIEAFCKARQDVLELELPDQIEIEKPAIEVLVERPRKDILESITTEELIGIIAKRLAPLLDGIPTLLAKGSDKLKPVAESRGAEMVISSHGHTSPRRQKVLLYGFLPSQETDIREKSQGFNLDISFAEKDSRMQGTMPTCQWCIMMIKSSHAAVRKLKRNYGKKIFLVHGVDGAVKTLADINAKVGMAI